MIIQKQELEYILYGACFLASGGGGPLSLGQSCIDANFTSSDSVEVVDANSIMDNEWIVPAAGMGLPSASFNAAELNQSVLNVINTMQHWCQNNEPSFSNFKYILPMEVGTVNSVLPIIAAKLANEQGQQLKVIDADPSGRATPTLPLTLFAGNNCAFYPNFIASGNQPPYYASYNLESLDHVQECFGQMFTSDAFKNSGGFSLYPRAKKDLTSNLIVAHTMKDAYELGQIIQNSTDVVSRVESVLHYMNNSSKENRVTKNIFYGRLSSISSKPEHGQDVGVLTISGLDEFSHLSFIAYTENENIYANLKKPVTDLKTIEVPYIMGPDSICYLPEVTLKDGTVSKDIIVSDVTQLQELFKDDNVEEIKLYVIGIDAPSNVKNCPGLIANWEEVNSSLGGEDKYIQPWLS